MQKYGTPTNVRTTNEGTAKNKRRNGKSERQIRKLLPQNDKHWKRQM